MEAFLDVSDLYLPNKFSCFLKSLFLKLGNICIV